MASITDALAGEYADPTNLSLLHLQTPHDLSLIDLACDSDFGGSSKIDMSLVEGGREDESEGWSGTGDKYAVASGRISLAVRKELAGKVRGGLVGFRTAVSSLRLSLRPSATRGEERQQQPGLPSFLPFFVQLRSPLAQPSLHPISPALPSHMTGPRRTLDDENSRPLSTHPPLAHGPARRRPPSLAALVRQHPDERLRPRGALRAQIRSHWVRRGWRRMGGVRGTSSSFLSLF
jgi:hypothetical protein